MVTVVFDMHHHPDPPHRPLGLAEYQRLLAPYLAKDKGGHIEASDSMQTLAITDIKENIEYITKLLKMMHHAEAPLVIEAKVIELRWDKSLQIGLSGDLTSGAALWTHNLTSEGLLREVRIRFDPQEATTPTPFQGSTFQFSRRSGHQGLLGGVIQSFLQRGRAQILSNPRVLVKADEQATIFAGEEIPFPAEILIHPGGTNTTLRYRNAGVTLKVKAHLAAPGEVILNIFAEVTSVIGFVQITSTTQAPSFTVRRVETEVLVRDGEEIVIGGLFRKEQTKVRRGLPFLSDLPILGYLFGKYEEDEILQEILFFIKPVIVKSEADLPRQIFDPDKK